MHQNSINYAFLEHPLPRPKCIYDLVAKLIKAKA